MYHLAHGQWGCWRVGGGDCSAQKLPKLRNLVRTHIYDTYQYDHRSFSRRSAIGVANRQFKSNGPNFRLWPGLSSHLSSLYLSNLLRPDTTLLSPRAEPNIRALYDILQSVDLHNWLWRPNSLHTSSKIAVISKRKLFANITYLSGEGSFQVKFWHDIGSNPKFTFLCITTFTWIKSHTRHIIAMQVSSCFYFPPFSTRCSFRRYTIHHRKARTPHATVHEENPFSAR